MLSVVKTLRDDDCYELYKLVIYKDKLITCSNSENIKMWEPKVEEEEEDTKKKVKDEDNSSIRMEEEFKKWYLKNFDHLPEFFVANKNAILNYRHRQGKPDEITDKEWINLDDENMGNFYIKNKELYEFFLKKPIKMRMLRFMISGFYDEVKKVDKFKNITLKEVAIFVSLLMIDGIRKTTPSQSFIYKQKEYIKNLTSEEKALISWYTHKGDGIMNGYLRNNLDLQKTRREFYLIDLILKTNYNITKDELKKALNMDEYKTLLFDFIKYAIGILNNVILNAPRNDKPFVVYQYADKPNMLRTDNLWENNGFYSTTLENANNFMQDIGAKNMDIYKSYIIVPTNTPCLYIANLSKYEDEEEILFPSQNCFEVLKPFTDYKQKNETISYYKRILSYKNNGICETKTLYTIENIYQYTEAELNDFLSSQNVENIDAYNIIEKRYLVIYYLYQADYIDIGEINKHGGIEKIGDLLQKANTYEKLKLLVNQ